MQPVPVTYPQPPAFMKEHGRFTTAAHKWIRDVYRLLVEHNHQMLQVDIAGHIEQGVRELVGEVVYSTSVTHVA